MVAEYLEPLLSGIQLVRESLATCREWKAGKGAVPDELERKLEQAEQQLKRAEAEAARNLGYRICKRHWPPGIEVDESYRDSDDILVNRKRCLDCGFVREWSAETPQPPAWFGQR
jgi:hypothetical protein